MRRNCCVAAGCWRAMIVVICAVEAVLTRRDCLSACPRHRHGKYKDLVDKCFDMNHIFVKALDQAFKSFVNTSVGGFNMSELLSYYCDHLMRGKKASEPELELEFDKVVRAPFICAPLEPQEAQGICLCRGLSPI